MGWDGNEEFGDVTSVYNPHDNYTPYDPHRDERYYSKDTRGDPGRGCPGCGGVEVCYCPAIASEQSQKEKKGQPSNAGERPTRTTSAKKKPPKEKKEKK